MEFTEIITANNREETQNTVNSLISQTLDFEKHVHIILIDNSKDNQIKSLYEEYILKYPKNFKLIENSENDLTLAKNNSIKKSDGKFLNFLNCGDTLSKNTLKEVLNLFDDNNDLNVISIPLFFVDDPEKNHWSNKRFEKTQVVDLIENPQYYQLFGPSSFIKRNSIKDALFKNVLIRQDSVFLNEILINTPRLGLCSEGKCSSPLILKKNTHVSDAQATKNYYTELIENYFKNLIGQSLNNYSEVPVFIQNVMMYDLSIMLHAEHTEDIFNEEELKDFKTSMRYVLSYIDDEIIFKCCIIDEYQKINAFLLKYGEINPDILNKIALNTVFIDTYDIINDELEVLANLPSVFDREVDVFVNGEKIEIKSFRFPQRDGIYFDYRYIKDYSFEFTIPLSTDETFEIEFKSNDETLSIDFSRPCNFSKVVGYAKSKKYLSILKDNKIIIGNKTTLKWIKEETKALIKMFKEKEDGYKVGIPFRIMYMLGYPFLKNKHIWFFMDHPKNADDNGMHLFRYAQDKDKNIKKYFILDENSKDLSKMEKIGDVLGFKSIKHRFLGMFAENIITSHPDNEIIYPFWGSYPHIAGLLKSNTTFLQHGIIKDDISPWLNKFNMNLSLFITSAPKEYESVRENPYHYDENVPQLLGLPRFDNLKNDEDAKQIVIMPSWRRPLTKKSKEFISKTEYFNRFNSLINNEKLIEICREHNYEIIFKPHPNVYRFIELYDENDYVKIDFERIEYQKIFNKGSLLVTDYSSVAFDFSYLHKPIIYYQYKDDYHFDVAGGYFKYETMGFGEVCRDENEIVDLICEYVENDCKIKEKYSKRIDDFFYYTDRNNCKRVYDAVKKLPLKD